MCTCQGQSRPLRTWFSPSNVWVPGFQHKLPGLVETPFIHPAFLVLNYEGYLQFILDCQLPFDFSIIITVLPMRKECKS